MILHCGDSYAVGFGCEDPNTQAYSRLISDHYGFPYLSFAKSGSSNYLIHLQILEAIERQPKLIIVNPTTPVRVEWFKENANAKDPLSIFDVNYYDTDHGTPDLIRNDPRYNPILLGHPIATIQKSIKDKSLEPHPEPKDKLKLIIEYHARISEKPIQKDYSAAILCMALFQAKQAQVPFVLLGQPDLYSHLARFFPNEILKINFREYDQLYPDRLGTGHFTPEAHRIVADKIINFIDTKEIL